MIHIWFILMELAMLTMIWSQVITGTLHYFFNYFMISDTRSFLGLQFFHPELFTIILNIKTIRIKITHFLKNKKGKT